VIGDVGSSPYRSGSTGFTESIPMRAISRRRESTKAVIDRAIRKAMAGCERKPRRAFADLLWKVQHRSDLLRPGRYVGRIEAARLGLVVDGLLALSEHRKGWLRPAEEWEPGDSTPLRLFSSLAHHLLANYPVPAVLLSAWFRGRGWAAQHRQHWFRHVGRGGSLRTAGLPIPVTKRMAHEFAHAPAHYQIEFALRWAQLKGLGGSDELALAVASTRLGLDFRHDEFWTSVFHLFLNTPRIEPPQVYAIVDYLHDRKFEPVPVIVGEGTEITLDAPEPDLSIKGRSVASLMRRAERWRAERRPEHPQRRLIRWGRSAIGEFRRAGDGEPEWTIREILDSDELAAEGEAMHHCVATYTDWCAKRRSTIWSLGSESPQGRQRLVTIEVDPEAKRVVQANMKCNEEPDERSMTILKEWAMQEGLEVEP
jgi:hypothetical protein